MKKSVCPYCQAINGQVKKAGFLKIIHDKYKKEKKSDPVLLEYLEEFDEVMKGNKDLKQQKDKLTQINLNPLKVLDLFKRIADEDIPLLLMNPHAGRPEHLILTKLPVPPLCIRPSVISEV
ncbi:DNA-directed RNA polymerase III subunit RPC1, partial [Stegodyphus mimosarum]